MTYPFFLLHFLKFDEIGNSLNPWQPSEQRGLKINPVFITIVLILEEKWHPTIFYWEFQLSVEFLSQLLIVFHGKNRPTFCYYNFWLLESTNTHNLNCFYFYLMLNPPCFRNSFNKNLNKLKQWLERNQVKAFTTWTRWMFKKYIILVFTPSSNNINTE